MNNQDALVQQKTRAGFPFATLVLITGLAILAVALWMARTPATPTPVTAGAEYFPRSEGIENEFGIRFMFLAVTADGGLIDLRYKVLDRDKAAIFAHYTETTPLLINEATGEMIDLPQMGLHNHKLEAGRIYPIMYRNTSNRVQPGSSVTIQLGKHQLRHVISY